MSQIWRDVELICRLSWCYTYMIVPACDVAWPICLCHVEHRVRLEVCPASRNKQSCAINTMC
jgi:hypothetical protein